MGCGRQFRQAPVAGGTAMEVVPVAVPRIDAVRAAQPCASIEPPADLKQGIALAITISRRVFRPGSPRRDGTFAHCAQLRASFARFP